MSEEITEEMEKKSSQTSPNRELSDKISPENLGEKEKKEKSRKTVRKFSILFFCLGVLWIFLFPAVTISTGELKCRGMFVDENALNPYNIRPQLKEQEMLIVDKFGESGIKGDRPPTVDELCAVFLAANLPCWTHVYEQEVVNSDLNSAKVTGGRAKVVRRNVYTVSRPSPGADGKDALVIAVDWPSSWHQGDLDSFRMALILLQHFRRTTFMSKNLIVLVTGNPEDRPGPKGDDFFPGAQAWLQDYFTDFNSLIEAKKHLTEEYGYDLHTLVVEHSGVIRAALVLDLPAGKHQWLGLKVMTAGINGQQPNLDLMSVTLHCFGPYSIVIDRCMGPLTHGSCNDLITQMAGRVAALMQPFNLPYPVQKYLQRLFGMFSFMAALVNGPSHAHAHFLHHSIDAVTLQGIPSKEEINPMYSKSEVLTSYKFSSAMSQLIRSLNNLEEDLHHSYFYYFMPLPSFFVEINEYLNALFGIMMPLFLQAFVTAIRTGFRMAHYTAGVIACTGGFGYLTFVTLRVLFWRQYEVHAFVGEVLGNFPIIGRISEEKTAVVLWLIFVALLYPMILAVLHLLKRFLAGTSGAKRQDGWKSLKCFCTFAFVFLHVMLGIVNYSFSLGCALVLVPIFLFLQPASSWKRRKFWLYNLVLLLVSPFALVFWLGCLYPSASGLDILLRLIKGYLEARVLYIPYICLVLCPLHLISIHILYS